MSDFPTPWASIGQAFEMADAEASKPVHPITAAVEKVNAAFANHEAQMTRLLADLQEHGYPQETKQEEES